jgi:hypothetical protein
VTAITGSHGHLQPVSPEKRSKLWVKNKRPQKPAKEQDKIRSKSSILRKYAFKRHFLRA